MTAVVIILTICVVLYVGSFVFVALWVRRRKADKGSRVHTAKELKACVDEALRKMNCEVSWEKASDSFVGAFRYQNGHFSIRLEKDSPYVRLLYLFIFSDGFDKIEAVRNVCNQCNLNTETARLVYSLNERDATVDVHILHVLTLGGGAAEDILERAMSQTFRWHRVFVARYQALAQASKQAPNHDSEKQAATWQRELFLLRELEMMHREEGPEWHEQQDRPTQMRSLLSTAMGLTDIVPSRLVLACDEAVAVVDDVDAILDYDLSTPLIADGRFVHSSAVALLSYYDPRNPVALRRLTLCFEQQGKTPDTLYYRITTTLSPLPVGRAVALDDTQRQKSRASVLIGHDLTPDESRQAEFRYVWKEAMAKQSRGHMSELTDEERLLCGLRSPEEGYDLLRGRTLYGQKRFYESVLVLENLFHRLQRSFDEMADPMRNELIEICYLIGACYTHLRQYSKASYYLQFTLPARRIVYMQMYVNCLVNGRDFRAMSFIDSFLQEASSVMEGEREEALPGDLREVSAFVAFLNRRKAYLLVRGERYEEAEALLRQLLDDPANSDFALRELAYIRKKKTK